MTASIRYCIEAPVSWSLSSNELILSGWCFGIHGTTISAIRVRAGGRVWEAKCDISRPDVAETYRDLAISELCGFSVLAYLRSGQQTVAIEAVDQANNVHTLGEYETNVPLAALYAHIDTPTMERLVAGELRFSGWCCHPDHRIVSLSLHLGDIVTECRYGIERSDVQAAYPHWTNSQCSGFEAKVAVLPVTGPVILEALLDNGSTCQYVSRTKYKVVHPPIWHQLAKRMGKLNGFVRFAWNGARLWKARHGRWPTVSELVRLSSRAWARFNSLGSPSADGLEPPPGFALPASEDPYHAWLAVNQWNEHAERRLAERLEQHRDRQPAISVIMPVYNPPPQYLEQAINSVRRQLYEKWELCIADDASSDPAIREILEKHATQEPRIRLVMRKENGNISRATNSAASMANGEFLVFLDNDDELAPDALAEIALYMVERPEVDFLYTDDDKIDIKGSRFAPQFKPDWSPELLLSYMYCSHLIAVRRTLFEKVGGMRAGFEGSQDFDFALRASEHARDIGHIPKVLYHWRVLPGSTAVSGDAKPASLEAGRRAVQEALDRRGILAKAYQPDWAVQGRLGIFQHEFPDTGPSVALIIPTKNQYTLLRNCIDSLRSTSYQNYVVVIIDNESDDPETLAYLANCGHRVLRIGNPHGAFNYAYINNRAVDGVETDYVLFLNNDTQVREPRWLSCMMGYAQIQGVGAVGARLLYPDGRIQHAGILHGLYHGMAGPAFKLLPGWDHGYLSYTKVTRNYSAVTAACLLTPRRLFLETGGFDEDNFSVAYNDVDYCYRLVDSGYRCVYAPSAELTHHEGYSRGFSDNPSEEAAFKRKYKDRIDPYYNPNLSLEDEHFRIQPRRHNTGQTLPAKTLMVAFNMNLEGAPYSQYELTVRLKELGFIDPVVFCPEDGPLHELYTSQGIEVLVQPHPLRGVYSAEEFDKAIQSFAMRIKQAGVRLVYGNTLQTFYAIAAAKQAGVPAIWNPRESEPWQSYFNNFGTEIAGKALGCFQYPYRVIFVAEATRSVYAALNTAHNFTVIHNGLDLARLENNASSWTRNQARASLGIQEHEIMFLLLGTVCARKGQHDLPLALEHLPANLYSRIQCYIVGDRPSGYSRELAGLLSKLPDSLRERVHVVPETAETPKYYKAADVFLCTSRIESYPRVILEAMAYQLPIITTPCYGIREQVRSGVNGIYYQPGESRELASAIEVLMLNVEMRQRYRNNSRRVLETLTTYEEMAHAYGRLFREASECGAGWHSGEEYPLSNFQEPTGADTISLRTNRNMLAPTRQG